ncbi:MAG: nucleoside hydrolase [Gemmatimonadetes bacterium]|nr:nucleoside hydrolase [Gemmatimonadota bacterium]|tara:strand:+ start:3125 stop:4033 length:909 start_codon:yes stop_codon:yes gene_type:complete
MSDFTVFDVDFPAAAKQRVIVNTDAKNEADDQYAIVHAVLTPSFDLHGIIPAHYGTRKTATSMQESHDETVKLLRLMGLEGDVHVADGASGAIADESTPVDSPGAQLIIAEAMQDDPRPLYIAFYGPLTDMASALLLEPRIAERNVRVIWIGGGPWPSGGGEYNLSNDIHAANVVMKSRVELWQVPRSTYRTMSVGYAELIEKIYPQGAIGKYLVEQLLEHNAATRPEMEYRSLGDSPCIGIILDPECGRWSWRPAPTFDAQMHYVHSGRYRPIRVYEDVNTRFIHEDLFAKLAQFIRRGSR